MNKKCNIIIMLIILFSFQSNNTIAGTKIDIGAMYNNLLLDVENYNTIAYKCEKLKTETPLIEFEIKRLVYIQNGFLKFSTKNNKFYYMKNAFLTIDTKNNRVCNNFGDYLEPKIVIDFLPFIIRNIYNNKITFTDRKKDYTYNIQIYVDKNGKYTRDKYRIYFENPILVKNIVAYINFIKLSNMDYNLVVYKLKKLNIELLELEYIDKYEYNYREELLSRILYLIENFYDEINLKGIYSVDFNKNKYYVKHHNKSIPNLVKLLYLRNTH